MAGIGAIHALAAWTCAVAGIVTCCCRRRLPLVGFHSAFSNVPQCAFAAFFRLSCYSSFKGDRIKVGCVRWQTEGGMVLR
jgi:hypothetical protein